MTHRSGTTGTLQDTSSSHAAPLEDASQVPMSVSPARGSSPPRSSLAPTSGDVPATAKGKDNPGGCAFMASILDRMRPSAFKRSEALPRCNALALRAHLPRCGSNDKTKSTGSGGNPSDRPPSGGAPISTRTLRALDAELGHGVADKAAIAALSIFAEVAPPKRDLADVTLACRVALRPNSMSRPSNGTSTTERSKLSVGPFSKVTCVLKRNLPTSIAT
mmetsp:Transcript_129045/g.413453  ORF Transcript_129045/g.413453 Transcript_129045/m.413453 type:complete len:219 (-) Transcript_129045:497-1153(-)